MGPTATGLNEQGRERYPLSTVIIENLFFVLWLGIGATLMWGFMPALAVAYVIFGVVMMGVVMRISVCGSCYYHNKMCHTGWGKLSALYCRQRDLSRFGKGFSGALIPLFYGSMAVAPLVLGGISTARHFTPLKGALVALFVFVVVMSSVVLRKKSCATCKMRDICPGAAVK